MENNSYYYIVDLQNNLKISKNYTWKNRNRARNRAEKLNLEYGAHRYNVAMVIV
jgi:hypothetical protein